MCVYVMCVYIYTDIIIYIVSSYVHLWTVRIVTKHRVQIKVEESHRCIRMTGILNRGDGDCAGFCAGFMFATCCGTVDGSTESGLEKQKVQSWKCLPYFLRCH